MGSSIDGFPSIITEGTLCFTVAEIARRPSESRDKECSPNYNSHVAQMEEASSIGFEIPPHHPYSPNLAPSDLHFFQTIKVIFEGQVFAR